MEPTEEASWILTREKVDGLREILAGRLGDVEHCDPPETGQASSTLVVGGPDHGRQDGDPSFALPDLASERLPGPEASDRGCLRSLHRDQHDIARAVAMESRLSSQVASPSI